MALFAGTRIGSYSVTAKIGEGGMGEVKILASVRTLVLILAFLSAAGSSAAQGSPPGQLIVDVDFQDAANFSCVPDNLQTSVEDGWIDANWVRIRIWNPWVHDAGCTQLDSDPEEEFFVISRTTGTGPYYRIQILDFRHGAEDPEGSWGVLAWSYYSDGKPKIEDGRVLLGEIPVDRWSNKGPPNYRPHRLTTDGLLPDSAVGLGDREVDCVEIAPTPIPAAGIEPDASFSLDLFG